MKKLFSIVFILFYSNRAYAHVKWFSEYQDNMVPVSLELLSNTQNLLFLSIAIAAIFISRYSRYRILGPYNQSLTLSSNPNVRKNLFLLLQVALFLMVLLCWRFDVVLSPELQNRYDLVTIIQFTIIACGFIPALRKYLPVGILLLFLIGIYQAGLFHMIDYLYVLGVAWFVWETRRNESAQVFKNAIYVLYFTTGFSLCWVGIEKLVYPQWAFHVLEQQPILALGLPYDFFVRGAAFVEFTIGFFFIIQLWPRVCAVILSTLMILTATLFGMTEIVGHLLLHAVLLLFIYIGSVRDDVLAMSNKPARISLLCSSVYVISFLFLTSIYYLVAIMNTRY